jgi:nucleoside-diphosphate-sugar epimerase
VNLLLTGATGFLGRNVLLRALAQGRELLVPVRNPNKLTRQLQFEKQDLQNVRVLPATPRHWPQVSPNCAILAAGVLFERRRNDYFYTNVDLTLATIRALPEECQTVVISSQSAGGPTPPGKASRTEEDADAPITWYGESKLALEKALRREFPHRPITILRPPMILGPRDAATLPLFRMVRGRLRIKPGLRAKTYSFIAVEDLVAAIFLILDRQALAQSLYVASAQKMTDWQLIASAAATGKAKGLTLPLPQLLVRMICKIVDTSPQLRARNPSLTCDRAREIWPRRWVVDGSRFEHSTGWRAQTSFHEALQAAHDYYVSQGEL